MTAKEVKGLFGEHEFNINILVEDPFGFTSVYHFEGRKERKDGKRG